MTAPAILVQKVLSFSDQPDVDGDIIKKDCINIGETIQIFRDAPASQNFVTFATPEVREDGLYVKVPALTMAEYQGRFLAPQGHCRVAQVEKRNGLQVRVIGSLNVQAINIVSVHSDPSIPAIDVESLKTEPKIEGATRKDKKGDRKVVIKRKVKKVLKTAPEVKAAPVKKVRPKFKRKRRPTL